MITALADDSHWPFHYGICSIVSLVVDTCRKYAERRLSKIRTLDLVLLLITIAFTIIYVYDGSSRFDVFFHVYVCSMLKNKDSYK